MSLTRWAYDTSAYNLAEALPRRWFHVLGVARRARSLRAVTQLDAELLEAAAFLHDVGYAPDLVDTGFHPIDGATYLVKIEAPERLVHLVHYSKLA